MGVNLEDGSSRRSSSDEDHITVISINGETYGIPQDDLTGVRRKYCNGAFCLFLADTLLLLFI